MRSLRVCCWFIVALVVAGWQGVARAMPANPNPIVVKQPDGTEIALRVHGDETSNWQTDLNHYPVERRPDGVYRYIVPADAAPGPDGQKPELVVGKSDPAAAGVQKGAPPRPGDKLIRPERVAPPAGAQPAKRILPANDVKNIVILIRFANHAERTLPSVSDIDKLFNAVGGDPTFAPTGSVRDIYLETRTVPSA
jgi:hypothetical protein